MCDETRNKYNGNKLWKKRVIVCLTSSTSHLVCDLEELQVTEEQLYVRESSTGQLTLTHLLVLQEALC